MMMAEERGLPAGIADVFRAAVQGPGTPPEDPGCVRSLFASRR